MPNTKEYMKEYIQEYSANCPEFYANGSKKNNEATQRNIRIQKKYYQQKKLAKLESVKMLEN